MSTPFMQLYEGKRWNEPRGQDALGDGALQRLYEASDGWFFLGAREADVPRLSAVVGLDGLTQIALPELAAFLEARFATDRLAEWVARLTAAGVGAHAVRSIPDLRADGWVREHGLMLTRDHPGRGLVDTTGPAPRLARTPVRAGAPASIPGADLTSVLSQLGRTNDLDRLVAADAVALPES